jgi:RNA-binding protein Musashi
MRDRMTGRPRGFGFVTFTNPESAETAVVDLHIVDGRQASDFTHRFRDRIQASGNSYNSPDSQTFIAD